MHLLCNAYWLDTDALQGCDLPKIKEVTYGFNQNADVVATLPPSPLDNFCASAKHNSSPNTYSIDSASLISSGENCSGAAGVSTMAQTFETYRPQDDVCDVDGNSLGYWFVVNKNGEVDKHMQMGMVIGPCGNGLDPIDYCERSGDKELPWYYYGMDCKDSWWMPGNPNRPEQSKLVLYKGYKRDEFVHNPAREVREFIGGGASDDDYERRYNFSTGVWTVGGHKLKNGNRVE